MSTEAKEEVEAQADGLASESYCVAVSGFFTPAAREMITRVLPSFLDQLVITAGELVHSAKYLKRLNDAGRVLMNATDKVATVQAKAKGEPPAKRLRELHELISTGTRKVWDDEKDSPIATVTVDNFASLAKAVKVSGAERDYQLGRILTELLFAHKQWPAKANVLAQLLKQTNGTDDFRLIELLMAELLRSEPALDQLLGFAEKLEDRCDDLLALIKGNWQQRETAQPVVAEIAALVAEGKAPNIRNSLEVALLRNLGAKAPLRSAEPEIEIQAVFDMFRRLWVGNQLLGGTKAMAQLERRQAWHMNKEGVTDLLRERKVVADRLAYLMILSSIAVGAGNRAMLKVFIDHYFSDKDFVPRTIAGQEPPVSKMQTLTNIHRLMKSSWLPDDEKALHLTQVETAQTELLRRSRLLEQVEQKGGGTAQKVLTLLDLCRKGTFIDGAPLTSVRGVVLGYMRDPRFLPEYLGGAQGEEGERKLALLNRTLESFSIPRIGG